MIGHHLNSSIAASPPRTLPFWSHPGKSQIISEVLDCGSVIAGVEDKVEGKPSADSGVKSSSTSVEVIACTGTRRDRLACATCVVALNPSCSAVVLVAQPTKTRARSIARFLADLVSSNLRDHWIHDSTFILGGSMPLPWSYRYSSVPLSEVKREWARPLVYQ